MFAGSLETAPSARFQPASDGPISDAPKVDHIVSLTGKLNYELAKEYQARKLSDRVTLIRLEES